MDQLQSKKLARDESLLSHVRGLILRENDIYDLGQKTCEFLAASLNYCAVWLARIEEHDRRALIIGRAGDHPELQETLLPPDVEVAEPRSSNASVSVLSRVVPEGDGQFAFEHAQVSLRHDGKVIGELHACLEDQRKDPAAAFGLLEIIAEDLAVGMIRIQRGQQHDLLVAEVESLRQLSAEIISGREIKSLFHILVEQVTSLLNADSGGLYVCESENRQVRCVVSHQTDRDYVGTVLPYGEGAAGVVAETGEPIIIPDYGRWKSRSGRFSSAAFHVVMSAPMRWQSQVTGVIHVMRDKGAPPFTQDDCNLLMMYANQAAVILENARLLEDIRKRVLQLDHLTAISQSAISASDLDELLPEFLQKLKEMLGADAGLFFQWNEAKQDPILFETGDLPRKVTERGKIRIDDLKIVEAALDAGTPLIADSAEGSPLFPALLGEVWEAKTLLAAPVTDGHGWKGVALLLFRESTVIHPSEVELVEQAIAQVTLTVAKMRALETERQRAPRARILEKGEFEPDLAVGTRCSVRIGALQCVGTGCSG